MPCPKIISLADSCGKPVVYAVKDLVPKEFISKGHTVDDIFKMTFKWFIVILIRFYES